MSTAVNFDASVAKAGAFVTLLAQADQIAEQAETESKSPNFDASVAKAGAFVTLLAQVPEPAMAH